MSDDINGINKDIYFSGTVNTPENLALVQKKIDNYKVHSEIPEVAALIQSYEEVLKAQYKSGLLQNALLAETNFLNNNPKFLSLATKAKKDVINSISQQEEAKQAEAQIYASSPEGIRDVQEAKEHADMASHLVALQAKNNLVQKLGMNASQIEVRQEKFNLATGEASGPVKNVRLKFQDMGAFHDFCNSAGGAVNPLFQGKVNSTFNEKNEFCIDLSLDHSKLLIEMTKNLPNKELNVHVQVEVKQNSQKVEAKSALRNKEKSSLPGLSTFEQIKKSAHSTFKDLRDSMKDIHMTVKSKFKK